MIWFEWKKILNGRVLLCFVVIHLAFLMLFWTQNSSVQKGRNTAKQQEIYQKIGGRLTASTAKEIEELKQRKDAVLEEEAQKEDEYAQGKISVDEYMKYRDEYHMMNDKKARKNGSWIIFDGYYDQLFRMDRTQWGLMLSVFLLIVLLVCCEPKELLATISVTREGRRGLWGAKLRTILMATLIFVILFAVEELMVIRQFSPLSYLDAPIQSISCLAGKHITISIAHIWTGIGSGVYAVRYLEYISKMDHGLSGYFLKYRMKPVVIKNIISPLEKILHERKSSLEKICR